MDFLNNGKENTTRRMSLTPVSREQTNKESGQIETKWFYADNTGKAVFKQLYDSASPFNELGLALVRLDQETNERYGFIDLTGTTVVPIIYDLLFPFNDSGFAHAKGMANGGILITKEKRLFLWSTI